MPAGTESAINERLVRYADLTPCSAAFPAAARDSSGGESFTIVESAEANIRAIRLAVGRAKAPYVHDAAEVLFSHMGRWRVRFGPNEEDGSEEIAPGDTLSVPPHVFRSIDKVDDAVGFLLIVRDPSDLSAPGDSLSVFEPVGEAGSARAPRRRWIDTSSGAAVLRETGWGPERAPPWACAAHGPTREQPIGRVIAAADLKPNPASPFAGPGVEEAGIVPCATLGSVDGGPRKGAWHHGFDLRMLSLRSAAYVPAHTLAESEVFFVHSGSVEIRWDAGAIMMGAGDTLSVPEGFAHSLRNTTSGQARLLVLRGTEDPSKPIFSSMPPLA